MPSSPASPGRTTNSASPEKIASSALTTSTWMVAAAILLLERLRLLEGFLDRPDHVERLLGQGVALAGDDHLEALDGVLERDVFARRAGEVLRHGKGLRQEALDLAGAGYRQLVLGRKLVHAENRDDVAQLLVALQRCLYRTRGVVVVFADHVRIHLARRRVERIYCRIDAERCDVAR